MRRGGTAARRHVQLICRSGSMPVQQLHRLVCCDERHGAARPCCDAHCPSTMSACKVRSHSQRITFDITSLSFKRGIDTGRIPWLPSAPYQLHITACSAAESVPYLTEERLCSGVLALGSDHEGVVPA